MTLTGLLPTDSGGHYFSGAGDWKVRGTQVGSTDEALPHVLLVDASDNPILYAVDGDSGAGTVRVQGSILLAAANGGPVLIPGDASNGLIVQVTTATGIGPHIGLTTGTAVTTDASGTLQQYLRGLVTILGAVTASPVANSIGDRLKALLTKTPALGTAGTPSADVISVQGVASGTAQPVTTPFSAAITPSHTTATATNSSSDMLASNSSRKYALLQNDGAVDVYIKIGATAVASQGIRLASNGGSYEMSAAFGNLMTGAVRGITASGSAVVLVLEG
jgi:hypothetical protein